MNRNHLGQISQLYEHCQKMGHPPFWVLNRSWYCDGRGCHCIEIMTNLDPILVHFMVVVSSCVIYCAPIFDKHPNIPIHCLDLSHLFLASPWFSPLCTGHQTFKQPWHSGIDPCSTANSARGRSGNTLLPSLTAWQRMGKDVGLQRLLMVVSVCLDHGGRSLKQNPEHVLLCCDPVQIFRNTQDPEWLRGSNATFKAPAKKVV